MCNVSIAKSKLQNLTKKTERDLYLLRYNEEHFTKLSEEVYYKVKLFCNNKGLQLPLCRKRNGGGIYVNSGVRNLYSTLRIIAEETGIVLDAKNTNN